MINADTFMSDLDAMRNIAGDAHNAGNRQRRWRVEAPVLAVVAAGGALGACARHQASLWWPTPPGGFPATTMLINITGCAVMGLLMVLITDVWSAHRLVRPFLGTGVLGGYTTFSHYAVDVQRLVASGHAGTALACLVATPIAALTATWIVVAVVRHLIDWRQR